MTESIDGIRDRVYRLTDRWEDDLRDVDRRLREMVDRDRRDSRYGIMRLNLRMHPDTWEALDRRIDSEAMGGIVARCNPDHDRESIALTDKDVAKDHGCPPKTNR